MGGVVRMGFSWRQNLGGNFVWRQAGSWIWVFRAHRGASRPQNRTKMPPKWPKTGAKLRKNAKFTKMGSETDGKLRMARMARIMGGWKRVNRPPEGCHPEGLEGSGIDRWRGAGGEAEMSRPAFARGYGGQAPLDMTGIWANPCPSVFIRGWIGGSRARKEAKKAQNWGGTTKNAKYTKMGRKRGRKQGTNYEWRE